MQKKIFLIILALVLVYVVVLLPATIVVKAASIYYVDAVEGNDNTGDGSSSYPWATIGKAAGIMLPGDTCRIRSGVYRETVTPTNSGISGSYITFEADAGADVTISGADPVTSNWAQYSGNIYKTTRSLDMGTWKNQVFVDGVAMNLARWPNAGTDPLNPVFKEADSGTDNYKIMDSELTQPDGYWDGAGVIVGDKYRWSIASTTVNSYTSGRLNLSSISTFGLAEGVPYYLIGKLAALDSASEWYYDSSSTTLYLQTPESDDPDNYTIEVKARKLAFDLAGKDYIRIKGIKMFANTLNTNSSNYIEIDGIDAKYLSHYELSHIGGVHQWPSSGLQLGGTHNVLRNSTLAYSPGNLVTMDGEQNRIINNLMHDAAYGSAYTTNQSHVLADGKEHLISHNTMYNSGRQVIAGSTNNCRIQYNHAYNVMKLTDDGGFMYFSNVDGNGTEIHHNVLHDAYTNPPHHIVGGIYLDFATWDFKVFNNVVSDVNTFGVFFHNYNLFTQAYNNTFYNVSKFRMKDDGGALDGYGTRIVNNITYDDLTIAPGFGILAKNNFTSGDPLFIDAENGDLRLQSISTAVDAGAVVSGITDGYVGSAPDIGAYEVGKLDWTAGHNFDSPPDPAFTTSIIPYQTLLTNGFFERETSTLGGWTKTYAGTAVIERSGSEATSSRNAWTRGLKLGSYDDGVVQMVTGLIPDTEYELRGFGKVATDSQTLRIGVKGYGGAEIYEEITSTSWKRKKIWFTTGPSDTSATIYIYKPTTGGYAYADDITLMEADPEAPDEPVYDDDPGDTEPGVITVNDRDTGTGINQYNFVGNWMQGQNIYAYLGDNTFSNTANNYYEVKFEGEQIKLYSEKSDIMGIVAVSIDGGSETMLDLYAQKSEGNVPVYTSPILATGQHILKVRITGNKNSSSGGTWHVADRVDIFAEDSGTEPEPEPEIEDVYGQDFEDTAVGSVPVDWTISTNDPVSVTEDTTGNHILTLVESGVGETSFARVDFTPIEQKIIVSLRVMAEQLSKSCNFLTLKDSSGTKVIELLFDNDYDSSGRHNIVRRTSGGWVSLMQYNADQWYDVDVEVNISSGTYSVSIDDAEVAAGISVLNTTGNIVQYSISSYRWDAGIYHVDDLQISGVIDEPEPEPEIGELYTEDFDSTALETIPDGWVNSSGDPVWVTEDTYGNHRLTVVESGDGNTSLAGFEFDPIEYKMSVDLQVMAEQTGEVCNFLTLKDSSGAKVVELLFDQDYDDTGRRNIARRTADTNWVSLMQYNANQWYDIHVDINIAGGTYSVSIDGAEVAEDIPVLSTSNEITEYSISAHRWDNGTFHLDNLQISGPIPES